MNPIDREYMTIEEKIEQAKRLIPLLEDEIENGETRQLFFDLLEAQKKVLARYGTNEQL